MIKKSTVILMVIQIFLCIMFLINVFVINIKNIYLISSFLLVNVLLVICFLGYEKNRQRLKKDAILNAFIFSSLLQIILYLSGLLFGFLKNGYSMKLLIIIKNVLPVLLLIVTTEILRYTINQKGKESKLVLILSCLTFTIVEVAIESMFYNFTIKKNIIELVCLILLPSISKNIFLTYNTTKFGFGSSIVYRIIMELTIYFTPIIPNISDYLKAIINFLTPVFMFMFTKKTIGKTVAYEEVKLKKTRRLPLIITIVFILTIIVLNTGLAPLYILAIGSGSMERTLSRGDAVIIKKIKEENVDTLNKGDILVYEYQNRIIVHRIYTIENNNNDIYIKTKGDNNDNPDSWYIKKENVIGKVILNIKYVGIPTIWLNDILG